MLRRTAVSLTVLILVISFANIAQGQEKLQDYFSNTATKVKATTDPSEKREILDKSLEKMSKALDAAQKSPFASKDDKAGIDQIKVVLKEKQDELAGLNGFERVPDAQLNNFADYVVQDMEQAKETITISVVVLLLIIILAVLVL